jgi:hypothetical protein
VVCAVLRSAWGPSPPPHHSLLFNSVTTMQLWCRHEAGQPLPQPDRLCDSKRLALGVHLVATCMQLTYRCVFVVYVVCVVFMGCVCV